MFVIFYSGSCTSPLQNPAASDYTAPSSRVGARPCVPGNAAKTKFCEPNSNNFRPLLANNIETLPASTSYSKSVLSVRPNQPNNPALVRMPINNPYNVRARSNSSRFRPGSGSKPIPAYPARFQQPSAGAAAAVNSVNGTFTLISKERFVADVGYQQALIEVFKSMPSKKYGKDD